MANQTPNGRPVSAGLDINSTEPPQASSQPSFATTSDSQSQTQPFVADPSFDSSSFAGQDFLVDPSLAFDAQSQNSFLGQADFSLFPAGTSQGEQFTTPLFDTSSLNPADMNSMASPSSHNTASPPGLLQPDGTIGSAQQSPSYNQQHFPANALSAGNHSRQVSLGPEAALLPGQHDWSLPQFQSHRRSPSEYSDVSSAAHSPNILSSDNFDANLSSHSPLQRPSDGNLYQINMGSFSIADTQGNLVARSPSHSPAISPRIPPQNIPDVNQQFALGTGYITTPAYPTIQGPMDDYSLQSQMAAPSINIDFAPTNAKGGTFDGKSSMDQDSLAPPERGRLKSRPRSVTDPFQPGIPANRSHSSGSGAQTLGSNLSPKADTARSLSPLDRRSASASSRRRQSTSSVPNNVIALRLADPNYEGTEAGGSAKRVQKHPATFQCTLCPKRFTRAYNLRSHLRTHTDERPFVCTVCGKAFARQHDRKRHESLHSGEKKFVCKGDLKTGGQWGCGRRFARADALGRHFRSEAGRICIKPLLDEEAVEKQRAWQEQRMQQNMAAAQQDATYPMDGANMAFPAALLAQYPALAQFSWGPGDIGGAGSGLEDELSGRSSFDASDYDDGEDGYISGSGTGYTEGVPAGQGAAGQGMW